MQQIKNVEAEKILFSDNYVPENKLSILNLQDLLIEKLNIKQNEALLFARYLIEPTEDEQIDF